MSTPEQTIRKFNPGTFQSDEEVIQQFVVRHHELDTVLEVLRGNIDSPSCQHTLIVAPRGRGKTMLLARVAAELRTNDELSSHLLPVWFMEESQEVFDIADFWLETLFYLARENTVRDTELAQELKATHADLAAQQHKDAFLIKERALAAVLEAADRLGKKLVLMVENLQTLCKDAKGDFGWQLREVLQTKPQIMLLATATSHFEGLDDAKEPFFELFRTIELKRLNTEECQRLWQAVSGEELGKREIRPLEILTGGDPRLLVIIASFARHRSLRQLMEDLVQLVDDHTEYFRSHLEALPSAERRVYLAVVDRWQASTTSEIAKRARMEDRKVSSFLKRLVGRGVVRVKGNRRPQRYEAVQRLYSIYYKLRRERDEAAVVKRLIFFLTVFYSGKDIKEMSDKWRSEAAQWPSLREGIRWAIDERPQIGSFFPSKEWFGIAQISNDGAMNYPETRGVSDGREQTAEALLSEGRRQIQLGQFEAAIATYEAVVKRFGASHMPELQAQVVVALVSKGIAQMQLGQFEVAIATWDSVIEHFGASDIPKLQVQVAVALVGKGAAQMQLGQFEAAIATCDAMVECFGDNDMPELQAQVASALVNKGVAQERSGQFEAAIATCDAMIERLGDSDMPELQIQVALVLVNKGTTQGRLNQPEAAIATYDAVVRRFGDSDMLELQIEVVRALVNKGVAQERLGQFEAAIATYSEVVEHFGDSDIPELQEEVAKALANKGVVQEQLGQFEAAIATYDTVLKRFGNSTAPGVQLPIAKASVNKGYAQVQLGQFEAAIATCDAMIECFGDSEVLEIQAHIASALVNKGVAQKQFGQFDAAIATCDAMIERFGDSEVPIPQVQVAAAFVNKGAAQGQLGQLEAAIATCDAMIERFGDSEVPKIQAQVAVALGNKLAAQVRLGQFEAVTATCDAMIEHFCDSEVPKIQVQVAAALGSKGAAQMRLGQFEAVIATCDAMVERFVDSDMPELQVQVASALVNKVCTQDQLGQPEAAIATCDMVVECFGASDIPKLQEGVVKALVNKGGMQGELGQFEAAIATYDEVVERFGKSDIPELQEGIARALINKGAAQEQLGQFEAAIGAYGEVVERFMYSDVPELQMQVAWALVIKGESESRCNRLEEALQTCDELEQRFSDLKDSGDVPFVWCGQWIRTKALLVQGQHSAAMDEFRSVVAEFIIGNEAMLHLMLEQVSDLIALGASERDLVEILQSDESKSDALKPLIVVLRHRAGEEVHAPAEVLEAAKDVGEYIRERIEKKTPARQPAVGNAKAKDA